MGRLLKPLLPFALLILALSCADPAPRVLEAVQQIPLDLQVDRFDQAFGAMQPGGLPALKKTYPYLFPEQYPDSVWLAKQQDTLQVELREAVDSVFSDFGPYQAGLEGFFRHARYYFPDVPVPHVVTLTTDVDYQNRVLLADTLLLLGLDNYLGENHRFYGGLDRYIAADLQPEYLVSDVASAFAKQVIPYPQERSFVAQMVYYGKELYLKDLMLPLVPDSIKVRYSAGQLEWARTNEAQIWRYFIERELLYNTDRALGPRFLEPAPFSKFRLELDRESPGRIGRYMGWQIVRAFVQNHDVSLQELLRMPGEALFKASNYKPPK
ncbi:gliding motility lipoprotein GldB [Robiginitalea sp. M366]|uniref:gliding motility lipoprotein GldB n=1 Tax=Robiginitalea aestuariiviva TaxID=3036903 RepID=UPI00240DD6B5|nr:gliding motility lipoprotein GldB [Robiginitalea aestuariiviva]MDG1570876.1 gliding motility lipoprotein GldB [Robiginitalea aestuariiviva]